MAGYKNIRVSGVFRKFNKYLKSFVKDKFLQSFYYPKGEDYMKKLFLTFLLITFIFSCAAYATDNNIEIVFSETFEGDLSRWCWNNPINYVKPFIKTDEKDNDGSIEEE